MSKFAIKAFDLLLIFLCSLIQTLTLAPPSNNELLASMDMSRFLEYIYACIGLYTVGVNKTFLYRSRTYSATVRIHYS